MGNSLAVQWLGLCASTAGGTGSIPGRGTKILHGVSKWWRNFIIVGLEVNASQILMESESPGLTNT